VGLEIAKAWVVVRGDVSKVAGDLNAGKTQIAGVVGRIQRMITGIGTAAAASFGVLRALTSAGQFEQTTIAFNTMIGSAEETKRTMEALTEYAAKTPFEMPEIQRAARGLIMFGERGDELMETLNILGNAAAGTSTDFGMLALIFNQIRGVGKLLTQDFRQLSTRGVICLQDIADHFDVATDTAQRMLSTGKVSFEDVREILKGLSQEGGRFHDMTEVLSTSYTGLLSTLKDSINLAARALGEGLLPYAKTFVEILLEGAEELRTWIEDHGELVDVFGKLLIVIGSLTTAWLVYRASIKAVALAQATLLALSGPKGWAILASGLAIAAIVSWQLEKRFNKLSDEVKKVSDRAKDATKETKDLAKAEVELDSNLEKRISRLNELNREGKLNNEQMDEAQAIIDKLTLNYGELGIEIDRSTGRIKGFKEAQQRVAEVYREQRIAELTSKVKKLTDEYYEADRKSHGFLRSQSYWRRIAKEINKELVQAQLQLHMLQTTPLEIPGMKDVKEQVEEFAEASRLAAEQAAEAAAQMKESLVSELKKLDFASAREEFEWLKAQVEAITREFPELEEAAKKFLDKKWAETPMGKEAAEQKEMWEGIEKQITDVHMEAAALRYEWDEMDKAMVKFRDQEFVTRSQIDRFHDAQSSLREIRKLADWRSKARRFEEEFASPAEKMRRDLEELQKAFEKGIGPEGQRLLTPEAYERARRAIMERHQPTPTMEAGRFGFVEYGRRLQDIFLKSSNPQERTAKATEKMEKYSEKTVITLKDIEESVDSLVSRGMTVGYAMGD